MDIAKLLPLLFVISSCGFAGMVVSLIACQSENDLEKGVWWSRLYVSTFFAISSSLVILGIKTGMV